MNQHLLTPGLGLEAPCRSSGGFHTKHNQIRLDTSQTKYKNHVCNCLQLSAYVYSTVTSGHGAPMVKHPTASLSLRVHIQRVCWYTANTAPFLFSFFVGDFWWCGFGPASFLHFSSTFKVSVKMNMVHGVITVFTLVCFMFVLIFASCFKLHVLSFMFLGGQTDTAIATTVAVMRCLEQREPGQTA